MSAGVKFFFSTNHFKEIQDLLKDVYGDLADFKTTIIKYEHSDYAYFRQPINSFKDFQLWKLKHLKEFVFHENNRIKISKDLISYYESKNGNLMVDELKRYSQILGIYPSEMEQEDCLFRNLVRLNEFTSADKKNAEIMFNTKKENFEMVVRFLISIMKDGYVYRLSNNRTVISQGYCSAFFRGENAIYGSSRASLFRGLVPTADNRMYFLINQLKLVEFSLLLNSFNFIDENLGTENTFHGALAQHYGFKTPYVDFTSNLKTALFFACCKFKNGKWRPLNKNEIKSKNSRAEIAKLGGNSRYGVLYIVQADFIEMSKVINGPYTYIEPIGIQPLYRCGYQNGFVGETCVDYNLYKDYSFEKVKFRLTKSFCNWIYKEMDCGKKIYPEEPIFELQKFFDKIKNSHSFSKLTFNMVFKDAERLYPNITKNEFLKKLSDANYIIEDNVEWCTKAEMAKVNFDWDTYYKETLDLSYISANICFAI